MLAVIGAAQDGPGCEVPDPVHAEITGISWFRADGDGNQVIHELTGDPITGWNTWYLDSYWDIGVYEGRVIEFEEDFDPDDSSFWLNDRG